VIRTLAGFQIPACSSPRRALARRDLFDLVGVRPFAGHPSDPLHQRHAHHRRDGRQIKNAGFTYVGISLDGIGEINDRFPRRGRRVRARGARLQACVGVGQRVGLRLTLTRHNFATCMAYSTSSSVNRSTGRASTTWSTRAGRTDLGDDLSREETRQLSTSSWRERRTSTGEA